MVIGFTQQRDGAHITLKRDDGVRVQFTQPDALVARSYRDMLTAKVAVLIEDATLERLRSGTWRPDVIGESEHRV
jgi:hypothetical protein